MAMPSAISSQAQELDSLRKELERLRENERQYLRAFRHSPVVFACTGPDLRYQWIFNPHPDFDPAGVVGKKDTELDHGAGGQALLQLKERVLKESVEARTEIAFDRSDGIRTYDIIATPVVDCDGCTACVLTTALDITVRKQAEDDLRSMNGQLDALVSERTREVRELAGRLVVAGQQERSRIAQLLHDDLQQQLYGVKLQLGNMRHHTVAGNTDAVLDEIALAEERLNRGCEMTRTLAVDLSPPVLLSEDFTSTLEWLALHMKDLHGLAVDLQVSQRVRTPDHALRVFLFRIVRELLFNIVKHAGTKAVLVEMNLEEKNVEIRITDEGRGLDVERVLRETTEANGFGLATVRRRLQMLGGAMEITSTPGSGTSVLVAAPLALPA